MADNTRSQSRRARRRRARQRRLTGLALGVVVAAGGGTAAVAATSNHGSSLELATAELSTVTETVEASGTIASSEKATPAFPVAGTVKSVDVKVGQSVTKGQTLATLDPTALNSAIDSAASALATAKQRLEADQTGQTSTSGTSAASGGSATAGASAVSSAFTTADTTDTTAVVTLVAQVTSGGSGGASGGPSLSNLITRIVSAQTAVINAQKAVDAAQIEIDTARQTVDTDVALNTTLRDAQQAACPTSPSTDPVTADCTTAMSSYATSADTLATDTATLDTKIAAQDDDLKTLDSATAALDQLLGQLRAAESSGTGSTGSTGTGSGSAGSGSAGTGSGGGGTATGGAGASGAGSAGGTSAGAGGGSPAPTPQPASASQLAADQASIDAAQAQLTVAEQNLVAATLASPTAGKVAAIGLKAGANSAGGTITIVGTGVQQVQATIPLTQIALIKAGQQVSIAADGVSTKLSGTVTSIGLLSTTSGSSTTFPVSITLGAGSPALFDGSGADVVITTGAATNVLTVPNSAIHSGLNGTHSVSVDASGKTSVVTVKLGLQGTDVTQVTSGVKAGQQVVIADLSTGLPGSSTTPTTTGFPGGAGGFGGGGARFGGARPGG